MRRTVNQRQLLLITLVGYALRLPMLDRFPFREDEAIYSYWALHGWYEDPLFLTVWPDKPPIFLWLLGAVYAAFGIEPAGARWLNIVASTLTIPLIAITARRLWGDRAGLIAALVMALCPFAISFSPTAFVDPMLVLAGSLALCSAVFARPLAAGFWLGAAVMTKQQGLLYVPLIVAMLAAGFALRRSRYQRDNLVDEAIDSPKKNPVLPVAASAPAKSASVETDTCYGKPAEAGLSSWHNVLQHVARSRRRFQSASHADGHVFRTFQEPLLFLFGLALSTLPIIWWDSRRWATAPSPWDLSVRNYGALALIPLDQWPERMQAWWPLVWQITASSAVWIVFALAMLSAAAVAGIHWFTEKRSREQSGAQPGVQPGEPSSLAALILMLWTLAYLVFHIASNVQIWDRYLLPLAPMLALLAGWAAATLPMPTPTSVRKGTVALLILLLALPSWQAAMGSLPVGSDHGAYAGLDESLAWIIDQTDRQSGPDPQPSILYHNALGWHHQFYLYEEIGRGLFTLRWFPTSTYLADNAEKRPDLRKFYVQPDWAPQPDLARRLDMRNLTLTSRFKSGHFTVYEVASRKASACAWCVCTQNGDPSEDTFGWKELKPDAVWRSTMMASCIGDSGP